MSDAGDSLNELGQPVGFDLGAWSAPPLPPRTPTAGRYCRLEILDPGCHGEDLYEAVIRDRDGRNWTYLPYGPFASLQAYLHWVEEVCRDDDPLFHAVVETAEIVS